MTKWSAPPRVCAWRGSREGSQRWKGGSSPCRTRRSASRVSSIVWPRSKHARRQAAAATFRVSRGRLGRREAGHSDPPQDRADRRSPHLRRPPGMAPPFAPSSMPTSPRCGGDTLILRHPSRRRASGRFSRSTRPSSSGGGRERAELRAQHQLVSTGVVPGGERALLLRYDDRQGDVRRSSARTGNNVAAVARRQDDRDRLVDEHARVGELGRIQVEPPRARGRAK
jgi:hypothetical protein